MNEPVTERHRSDSQLECVPLFVDLDGTVLKSDLGAETALLYLKRAPWNVFILVYWLLAGGRARVKAELASRVELDLTLLPLQEAFVAFLRNEASRDRPVYLATASDRRIASHFADGLGFFRGVIGSDRAHNLKGARKLDAILKVTAGAAFDYAGNGRADVPIWSRARRALLVNPELGIGAVGGGRLTFDQVFEDRRPLWRSWLIALRLHHWLKNLLLGVPLLTAHAFDAESFSRVIVGFFAFGLIASGSYLLNDLVDLGADRQHPSKRRRPFAAGELPLLAGVVVTICLLCAGLIVAALLSTPFLVAIAAYLVLTLAYSLYLKALVLIDVMTLAGLYTIRIIAGAAAISVEVSSWLLAFSLFIFMSLALVKRCSELRKLVSLAKGTAAGRGYRVEDALTLNIMGIAAGYLAVLVMALFVDSSSVSEKYQRAYLMWLECPLLLYWVSRLWLKTSRGEMNEDPVVYSLRDWASWVVLVAMTLVVFAAI